MGGGRYYGAVAFEGVGRRRTSHFSGWRYLILMGEVVNHTRLEKIVLVSFNHFS